MKKLRILMLVHETLVPPDDITGLSETEIDEFRTEHNVQATLLELGHRVEVLGIGDSIAPLRAALEEFSGIVSYDHYVVAYLELMRQPYTGCNPRGMMISRDKILTKQVLAYHRIPTPAFHVFQNGKPYKEPRRPVFPLIVKSASDDASLGISQASIVHDGAHLRERVEFIREQTRSNVIAEQYIEGREIYVGIMGNDRLTTFPVWELDFGTLSEVQSGIATRRVKWDRKYQAKHGIKAGVAKDLSPAMQSKITQLAKRIYRSVHMTGYGRMDMRMREDGSLWVLEANANPDLTWGEDFAESAERIGILYPALLTRILALGLSYQPEWRMFES